MSWRDSKRKARERDGGIDWVAGIDRHRATGIISMQVLLQRKEYLAVLLLLNRVIARSGTSSEQNSEREVGLLSSDRDR